MFMSTCNVCGCRSDSHEGVEEAQRRLAGSDEAVIEQRDNTGKDWARAAGAGNESCLSTNDNLDVLTLSGNIRESTTGAVELAGVGSAESGEVGRDNRGLVGRRGKVVGETT